MSIATILMILGAVAAFLYGIWAGLGTWDQSQDEIDRAISEPGRRRKATRHFTPLDLMARMTGIPTQRDRRNPFRFGEDDEGLTDPSKASTTEGTSGRRRDASSDRRSEGSPDRRSEGSAGKSPEEPARGPESPSASQEGVDRHEDAPDDGAQEVAEADDQP